MSIVLPVVAAVCAVEGLACTIWFIYLSINWRGETLFGEKVRQFFQKPVQVYTLITLVAGTCYLPIDSQASQGNDQSGSNVYTRAFSIFMLIACVTSLVWGLKIRSEVLLCELSYYNRIVKLILVSISLCWIDFLLLAIPLEPSSSVQDPLLYVVLALSDIAGLGLAVVSVIFTTVYYRFIKSKTDKNLKYRPVYLVVSQYGLALSLLLFLGTAAISANLASSDIWYSVIVDVLVSAIMLCLVLMKYQMNIRQAECDNKNATPAAVVNSAATANLQNGSIVTQVATTFGNTSTYFNIESRVVAIPVYLQVDLKSFAIEGAVLAEGGDAQVKSCKIIDPSVYTSWQSRYSIDLSRLVVKLLHQVDNLRSPELIQRDRDRFLQEVSVLSSLQNHLNVAQILGYSEQPRAIVMVQYDGSLRDLILDKSAQLPVLSTVRQVLAGLAECHKFGITHCDIKPGNILFIRSGQSLRIVLSDFGISQVKLQAEKVETRHNMRVDAWSFTYAPPELLHQIMQSQSANGLLLGKQMVAVQLDQRDNFMLSIGEAEYSRDIFSFGIVMWEMVSRALCWQGLSSNDIFDLVLTRQIRPPTTANVDCKDLSSKLQSVVEVAAKYFTNGYASQQQLEGEQVMAKLVEVMVGSWCHEPMQRLEAKLALEMLA